jgi:hypothetical protein
MDVTNRRCTATRGCRCRLAAADVVRQRLSCRFGMQEGAPKAQQPTQRHHRADRPNCRTMRVARRRGHRALGVVAGRQPHCVTAGNRCPWLAQVGGNEGRLVPEHASAAGQARANHEEIMEAQDQTQLIGGAEQSRSSANRKTSRADTPLFHVVPDSGPPSGEGSANTPGKRR